jgi:hypothetical protein
MSCGVRAFPAPPLAKTLAYWITSLPAAPLRGSTAILIGRLLFDPSRADIVIENVCDSPAPILSITNVAFDLFIMPSGISAYAFIFLTSDEPVFLILKVIIKSSSTPTSAGILMF